MPQKFSSPTPAARPSSAPAQSPLRTLRLGRLKAAIWDNSSEKGPFFNVKFARVYLDEQKKFHDTDNYSRDDLLLLAKLADQAHTFICDQMAAIRSEEGGDPTRRG